MSNRLSGGISTLGYLGTNAANPPNVFMNNKRAPTTNDWQNFSIGDIWIYNDIIPNTQVIYMLVSLSRNIAIWQDLGSGSSMLNSLSAGTGSANPIGGVINIAGGTNINTAGATNVITVNLDTTLTGLTALTTGNLTATGSETFSNLTQGVVQSSSTGLLSSSEGTDGQILISSSVGAPSWANITAGANITITNSHGGISIASTGGSGTSGASIIGTSGDNGNASVLGTTSYLSYLNPFGYVSTPTAIASSFIAPTAGVLNNLYVNVITNGSTTNGSLTLYINGALTALTTTLTALTTGTFTDLTHSVSVSIGDIISYQCAQATTANILGIATMQFTPTGSAGSSRSVLSTGYGSTSNAAQISFTSGEAYIPPFGLISSTLGFAQFIIPVAGTITKLYVNVHANTATDNGVIALNVNGSDTALTTTVTALTTGTYTDLTHSVSVSAGDLITFSSTQTTVGVFNGNISVILTA